MKKKYALFGMPGFACFIIFFIISCHKPVSHSFQNVLLDKVIYTDSLPFGFLGKPPIRKKDSAVVFKNALLTDIDSVKRKAFSYQERPVSDDPSLGYLSNSRYFYVLYAFKGNKVYVIFDTDNNGIFEGEKVYDPDTCRQFIPLNNLPYNFGQSVKKVSFFVRPCLSPFGLVGLNYKYDLQMLPIYKQGSFKAGNIFYDFTVCNFSRDKYDKQNTALSIKPFGTHFKTLNNVIKYMVGDTLYLRQQLFLFAGTNEGGDTLKLEKVGTQKLNYGVDVNSYAFNITGNDLMTGKSYTIGATGKYTLLDFWGTWCGPCKALTPYLKSLRERIPESNLDMVSIAFDESENDVKEYLVDKQIHWVNFFDDQKKALVTGKFNIHEFPTLILLDGDGKIILRGTGKDAFDKIETILKNRGAM